MPSIPSLNALKQRYKQHKPHHSDEFNLRIYRAMSWLRSAEESPSLDHRFISLWIAFNAAYGREFKDRQSHERATLNEFLGRICLFDDDHTIYNLIWEKFSGSIRLLLNNEFVFQPFWDYQSGNISEMAWQNEFARSRDYALTALEEKNTQRILTELFNRLYTLRNQIMHGNATFESSKNRDQLKDGSTILAFLLPAMLDIMLAHHNEIDWGKPFYPVV